MILTYSNPRFKDLILSGQKIHTIREDKNRRWKPGMKIQHWMGNPRNPSKNPHCFAEGICTEIHTYIYDIEGPDVPDCEFVDLWVNDEAGTVKCEQSKIC